MTTVAAPAQVPRTGPAGPLSTVPAPPSGLRGFRPHRPAWLWFLGAHGGAGETTLTDLLPNAAACDHRWPVYPDVATERPVVVLVARTSYAGLTAARLAATQHAAGATPPVELLGLVLSPDAPGRTPKLLREFSELVAGGVPRVWHLPWVEEWRTGDKAGSKITARLFDDLAQLTQPERTTA